MKRTLSLLASTIAAGFLLTTSTEVLAFGGPPGGPFSNGSYFPNDGTFSAVVRGENLTGTLQFSTTSVGGAGSTGVSNIYYDGDSYQGNSQGAFNPQASTMTVSFQADAQGQGEQSIQVSKQVTNTTTENGTTTTSISTIPYREISYFDAFYLNGEANCKTSNSFPNQKFEGNGNAEFQQLVFTGNTPFLDAVVIPITVTGVRLSNTGAIFNTSDVRPPSVTESSVLVE
jgi:hypothetical protein